MDQFERFLQYEKEVEQSKLNIIERFQQQGKSKSMERMSNIQMVEDVLNSAGHPLHISEIIRLAEERYQIKLQRDSIVSAVLKKINADQTFIRTAPNTFALKTYTGK
jgi:DNA-directed RNA polymerase delta subunit